MAAQPPAQPVGGAAAGSNPSSSASKAPDLSIMMPRDPPKKKKKKASAVKTAPAAARQRPSKLGKTIKEKRAPAAGKARGPWLTQPKGSSEGSSTRKQPPNAFMRFMRAKRQEVQGANPAMTVRHPTHHLRYTNAN